jgi:hypothetical protein
MAGFSTFKRGYIWRIGTDDNVDIFQDPWITSSPNRRVLTPRVQNNLRKVNELIDPLTGMWDEGLLPHYFLPIDVNRILQIPLNSHGFDDFVAWHSNRNGRFTVRSAYHLQWRHTFGPRANQLALPVSSIHNSVWKELWRLKIPSKIKIFAWRALHGLMPLKSILANHHVGTSGQCPICQQAPEDILHLLFQCQPASALWSSLGLDHIIEEAMMVDRAGSAVLEHILRMENNSFPGFAFGRKETTIISCWYLWWIRRCRTHDETVPPMHQCKMAVLAIAANSAKAVKKTSPGETK